MPELAQSLALILHELATNAVKYGALSTQGRVKLLVVAAAAGQLRFVWQEFGGPRTVARRPRRGSGSPSCKPRRRIWGRSANSDFRDEGFVYTLQGPFELMQPTADRAPVRRSPTRRRSQTPEPVPARTASRCRILVVEDEALVALQLQSDLEQRGYRVVGPGAVAQARPAARRAGGHRRRPSSISASGATPARAIADQLLARDIPFAFATGYSEAAMLPEHLREIPKLSKPYGTKEICDALNRLIPQRSRRLNA